MNKELIIKLAKLANNNPNEHEANSAARRVCKLLAEGNFNFGGTWNDVKRSTEPEFRSSPPPNRNDDPFWRMWEEVNRRQQQAKKEKWTASESQKRRTEEYKDPFQGSWNIPYDRDPYRDNKKSKNKRKCVECGLETETYNTQERFVCKICRQTNYKRETRQPTDKEKAKYSTHIHQCECGERAWMYDVRLMRWVCLKCKKEVTIGEAAAKDWIMQ